MIFEYEDWVYRVGSTWQAGKRLICVAVCRVDASGGLVVCERVLLPMPHPAMGADGILRWREIPRLVVDVWGLIELRRKALVR